MRNLYSVEPGEIGQPPTSGEADGHARCGGVLAIFLAGERADPDTIQWAERFLKKPVLDHWW
jgi:acyl-coenzyme A synthetase/AMP-(fatty) acid ligase